MRRQMGSMVPAGKAPGVWPPSLLVRSLLISRR